MKYLLTSLLLVLATLAAPGQPQPLQRIPWTWPWQMRQLDAAHWLPATVPGAVHTDLMAAGLIPDPFYRLNARDLDSLEGRSWEYRSVCHLSRAQLKRASIRLVFEGLDTYAEVWVNDSLVLQAHNMFRTWEVEVKPWLRPGPNQLRIVFTCPLARNLPQAQALGYALPADNEAGAWKVGPFSRKAAYHFGWDWGPRIITAGIWQPLFLELSDGVRLGSARVRTNSLTSQHADLTLEVDIHADVPSDRHTLEWRGQRHPLKLKPGLNRLTIPFSLSNPRLWYPHNVGTPHLYHEELTLRHRQRPVHHRTLSYGLRTVELVQEPDSIGTSYFFRVNGQPVFMQGANYIPQDMFLSRVTPQQYRHLLTAARDAHMNMLRVWGGGVYERDIFYQLCDSLGIMVWQDLMFAGTMYPGDSAFTANVAAEVDQQARRIGAHPSLALWCGNNEIEVAWHNWGWQQKYHYSPSDSARLWQDYLRLFRQVFPDILAQATPEIPYVPTSPLSNWGQAENFNHHSMHYWGVWHGRDSIGSFAHNVGRFMVEYGLQSYPSMATIAAFSEPSDWDLNSAVMTFRQRSYIGNGEILRHVRAHLGEPTSFEDFVTKSQAAQALGLRTAIQAHRHSQGRCMGSLFWQLNDCWPGPSWSVIDYFGRRKLAYEAVKGAFGGE